MFYKDVNGYKKTTIMLAKKNKHSKLKRKKQGIATYEEKKTKEIKVINS